MMESVDFINYKGGKRHIIIKWSKKDNVVECNRLVGVTTAACKHTATSIERAALPSIVVYVEPSRA